MGLINELHLAPKRELHVAVLIGEGISAESGVPIFRGEGSMWEDTKTRELAQMQVRHGTQKEHGNITKGEEFLLVGATQMLLI
ncbi:MAG: hypothetical protein ACNYVW_07035 [Methanosarcinales archaeon]